MSLRARLAVLSAVAVAVAVLVVSAVAYRASRDQQQDAFDDALTVRAVSLAGRAGLAVDFDRQLQTAGTLFSTDSLIQVVDGDGTAVAPPGQEPLPVDDVDRAVARGEIPGPVLRDVTVDGEAVRLVTVPVPDRPRFGPGRAGDPTIGPGRALQMAESRQAVDESLAGLRRVLVLVAALGVAGAAVAGTIVARRALRPVGQLTDTAEHVAATQRLDATIPVDREDELGRLAMAFNEMLAALDRSRAQQQQLVTDAGHELRTPLTSLRTNVELLQRAGDLPAEERRRIVDDAVDELEELSTLVAELIDLATDTRRSAEAWEPVRLADVVQRVAERWRRRRAGPVSVTADHSVVVGSPVLLDRAVTNLVDNATKWSVDEEPIDVLVAGGRVSVRDRGPGIAPEDRERVFDRFYRAVGGQDIPGSGLGLAIVAQVIEAHGGTVFVEDPADGPGVVVGFSLPAEPAADDPR